MAAPVAETSRIAYVVADADGLRRLSARLGLERFEAAGALIDAAESVADSVRFHVAWTGIGDAWISLRRADDQPAFCASARVAVGFAGAAEVTRPWALLMRRIAATLGDLAIDDLVSVLRTEGASISQEDRPSTINAWDADGAWRGFLCDQAQQRKLFESFTFEGTSTFIVHGDLECKFITPRTRVPVPRFFNYPFALMGDSEGRDAFTDLGDLEVIEGSEAPLEASIVEEIRRVGDQGPVVVNSTCVPVIIGHAVDEVVARHAHECAHGLFHLSPRTKDPMEIFLRYLDAAKARFRAAGGRRVPGGVALAGFRDDRARGELIAILAEAGIPVTGAVLPVASEARMEHALAAEVLVVRPSVFHEDLYGRLFGDWEGPRLEPPAPWGFTLSRAWFAAVGEAAGRRDEVLAVVDRRLEALSGATGRAIESTGGRALGFVIDPEQVARLVDPLSATGLPIARVARDLGFPVRVLIHAADAAAFRDFRDRLLASEPGLDIRGFASPDELRDALTDRSLGAVFTEYFFDRRLSRRGQAQFSAREFEMGLEGAVRTRSRLARLAGMPFWRTHGARLGSAWWA